MQIESRVWFMMTDFCYLLLFPNIIFWILLLYFSELFETIAKNCVSIRSLEIDIQADDCFDYDDVPDYIEVADLGWITSFERLEKLTIKCNVHFPSMAGKVGDKG